MPPMMGAASGFITSDPARLLHKIGSKLATMVATVITIGRNRNRAPSLTACNKSFCEILSLSSARFFATASCK